MGAVALWVRSTLRRHVAVTLALAMLAGVSAGIVGFALQAARRSEGSLARYEARNLPYDVGVVGCAPGVDPTSDTVDFQVVLEKCLSLEAIRQFRTDVVSKVPGVEAQSIQGVRVIGILDPTARNGWGRLILAYVSSEADPGGVLAPPLIVQGRRFDENDPDEVVLGETAAARAGIHLGDVITIGSWSPEELDLAIDGRVPPSTPTFTSRVVGIVRTLADVQATSEGDLRGTSLPDALFAGRAWTAAHGADLPGYGDSNAVRLASGPSGIGAFKAGLQRNASGRFFEAEPYTNPDELRALQRVIETERQALLVFAVIAALAGVVLVGLTVGRQLRRELADSQSLTALGMSSRDLAIGGVVRVAVTAVIAVVVAVLVVLTASPFAPIGIARPLEYSHPIRLDRSVLTVVPLVTICFLLMIGAVVPLLHLSTARRTRARRAAPKPWMLALRLGWGLCHVPVSASPAVAHRASRCRSVAWRWGSPRQRAAWSPASTASSTTPYGTARGGTWPWASTRRPRPTTTRSRGSGPSQMSPQRRVTSRTRTPSRSMASRCRTSPWRRSSARRCPSSPAGWPPSGRTRQRSARKRRVCCTRESATPSRSASHPARRQRSSLGRCASWE